MHNSWTTGVNWGRHAGVLGTSCGQPESSTVLGSQALCSPSQPTRHSAARRNDGPPGGQLPEPRRPGDRAPQGVRREPLAVGPEVGIGSREPAQDTERRRAGRRRQTARGTWTGRPRSGRHEGHRDRGHAAGPPGRHPQGPPAAESREQRAQVGSPPARAGSRIAGAGSQPGPGSRGIRAIERSRAPGSARGPLHLIHAGGLVLFSRTRTARYVDRHAGPRPGVTELSRRRTSAFSEPAVSTWHT